MDRNLSRASWIRRMYEEGRRRREVLGSVFDFSLGNPDLEPPSAFSEALRRLASEPAPGSHGYMPNPGYPDVRAAVAAKASRDQGVSIPASGVVMSVGAAGGLNVVLKTILDPGDEVVVLKPYFAEYVFYVENYGCGLVAVDPRPDLSPDPEALARALSPKTACVIVNSPNNPTGRVYSEADLEAIAEALAAHGRKTGRTPYIVADEPYRDIVYGGRTVPSVMAAYAETIVVSSWSKSLSLPGERIGYVAISPRCADAVRLADGCAFATRVLGFVNAPALMQRAVASVLDEKADVASYERRGRVLADGLRAAGYEFPEPEGAFYLFVKAPASGARPGATDVDFVMFLADKGVIAVPGEGFGCPGYFRLSFCVSMDTIEGAVPLFASAMREWTAR